MTTLFTASAFVAAAMALAACGKPVTGGSAMQVAARVNGNEIRVREVTRILDRNGTAVAPQHAHDASTQALDHLIDQELLVQKALAAKLEQQPEVADAIAAERRRILGLAWLDRTVPRAPERSPEEIGKFFYANPALFERRRIYETRELALAVPLENRESLRIQVAHAAQLDDVARWLKAQGLAFRESAATRPAEEVPLDMLPRLSGMADGQIALFPAEDRLSVLQLVHARNAPLDLGQATPIIDRMLANRWRLESAMNEVRRLRESARIEYFAPFEDAKRTPNGSPGAAGRLRLTADRYPLRADPSGLL